MMKQQEQVKTFQLAFNHPVASKPTFMDKYRAEARMNWVKEEVDEFLEADNVIDQADALVDALYFILGSAVEIGVDLEPVFDIVQKANMAKLWADGKPHFRTDGKVIKPEGWQAPEPQIQAEVERQMK
jgi:predicted HAD superfamily Cof-like phosphohydrolase